LEKNPNFPRNRPPNFAQCIGERPELTSHGEKSKKAKQEKESKIMENRIINLIVLVLGFLVLSQLAQAGVSVFATGLNNPRGLKFGPDGNLYVAEGGIGGANSTEGCCEQVIPQVGPYTGSATG
jgi:hypothetical protein